MRNLVAATEFNEGCPEGKAHAGVKNDNGDLVYGYVMYDSLEAALKDAGDLLLDTKGSRVVINYKEIDGSMLHVYELRKVMSLPRQEPMDFSWLNPFNW